ncbi:CocE/NonD family hydrolase C-terminal non-catalytic domain-containing protein [Halovivax limisalsi]|uniref:CocE/NonD family hydrolase C-terminal non-catalytic domain-containing protein n=1 Tax=Halovivax limisalsi TaxID=1453760 RepID=UPI003CCE1FC6
MNRARIPPEREFLSGSRPGLEAFPTRKWTSSLYPAHTGGETRDARDSHPLGRTRLAAGGNARRSRRTRFDSGHGWRRPGGDPLRSPSGVPTSGDGSRSGHRPASTDAGGTSSRVAASRPTRPRRRIATSSRTILGIRPERRGADHGHFGRPGGAVRARVPARRSDVHLGPLDEALELIGPISADLVVDPVSPHADVYVCLCEVDADGGSRNVCETSSLRPDETANTGRPRRVTVECWPTAFRVDPGSRLRVQVAGGAFPRWSRNPGTGAPIGEATTLRTVEHAVRGGPDERSGIRLPAFEPGPQPAFDGAQRPTAPSTDAVLNHGRSARRRRSGWRPRSRPRAAAWRRF